MSEQKKGAYLIPTEPKAKPQFITEDELDLETCYKQIGNGCDTVELLRGIDDKYMIVDENGAICATPILNHTATLMVSNIYGFIYPIYGNVIICEPEQFQ